MWGCQGCTSFAEHAPLLEKKTELDHIHDAIKHFSGNRCKTDEP